MFQSRGLPCHKRNTCEFGNDWSTIPIFCSREKFQHVGGTSDTPFRTDIICADTPDHDILFTDALAWVKRVK